MQKSIINVENLSVIYNLGKSTEFSALTDINLSIYSGEYIFIFGPSGCGKSTLLFSIASLQKPTKGRIVIEGKSVFDLNLKELINFRQNKIGMVFQRFRLISSLTVLDNVTLPKTFIGFNREARNKKAKKILEELGLKKFIYKYPNTLSGGQQQRVAIARALINDPPIILADEPTGNLDSVSAKIIMDLFNKLNKEYKKTVILVTHDADYLYCADRIFYLKDGHLIRTVTNKPKVSVEKKKIKGGLSEILKNLAKIYPNLSEERLKAKALSQYFLTSLDEVEIGRLESLITKRINGEYGELEFKEILAKPFKEGGIGFYKHRAENFAQKIETILAEANFLQSKFPLHQPFTAEELKAQEIRRYLLDRYKESLELKQIERMDHFLRLRIEHKIDKNQLYKFLDLPYRAGGVGLNRRTARHFVRIIELLLIKY